MVAVAYKSKETDFSIGDYVRTNGAYRGCITDIQGRDAQLGNGNWYFMGDKKHAGELTLLKKATAICDVCEESKPGVITEHMDIDGSLSICAGCRDADMVVTNEQLGNSEQLDYTRPAQALAANRLELVTPCTANGVKIADLVMEAENIHAVPQIAGLLPAPKITEPMPTDPSPKYNIGDYVVIDASHEIYYGREGKITSIRSIVSHGVLCFRYAVDTLYTNIPEGKLHPATPEKPAAYLAFKKFSSDQLYLGKLVFIHADAGYVTYGSYASVVESVTKRHYKGQWLPSGVYELFIPMKDMPRVQKDILSWGKFFIRLNADGSQPPLFPAHDASYMVTA